MPSANRKLRVFLCHASQDKPIVRELHQRLKSEGWIDPWLDEEKLKLGQHWMTAIEEALDAADIVLIFLSKNSVSREGFVQRELNYAWELSLEKPRGVIFLIPFRLDDCQVPRYLASRQWGDYFGGRKDSAYSILLESLITRHAQKLQLEADEQASREEEARIQNEVVEKLRREREEIIRRETEARVRKEFEEAEKRRRQAEAEKPKPMPVIIPTPAKVVASVPKVITLGNGMEFMRVPAGKFTMGSAQKNPRAWDDERPQHTVDLPYDFWMARYPITNELYAAYAKARGITHPVGGWEKKKDRPVTRVSWQDAIQYCQWLNEEIVNSEFRNLNLILRLPTEAEWEKAARGTNGNEWPWGNEFDKNKCNSSEGGKGGTTPVGQYSPQGDSPFGCADMAGNVWEWTHSVYKPYPYKTDDGREDEKASGTRVLRGGSFSHRE